MKKKIIVSIVLIFVFLVLLCYLYFENTTLQVTNYNVKSEKLPKNFEEYKIAQISDFHNDTSNRLVNKLIQEVKEQKPNIIVITGDFIDSKRTNIEVAINFVKEIKDVAPIFFVTGNHEKIIDNYWKLQEGLLENGVVILNDKSILLQQEGEIINLVGVDDPYIVSQKNVNESVIIKEKLDFIEYEKENYTILLSHRPELFEVYVNQNIDLVLSGHAHGGQIRLPFIGGLVAPNQGVFPKYTNGSFTQKNTTMIVSRGIGNSIFPFRINNKPELIIVTLNRE